MSADGVARVLLVEDHPIVLLGLRTLFDREPDFAVVAEVTRGVDVAPALARHSPDLVILPLRLEGEFGGVALCRELVESAPDVKLLVYSSFNSADEASAVFLSGANSYVHKGEAVGTLVDAARTTLAGRRVYFLGASIGDSVVRLRDGAASAGLTTRESEILALMLQHLSNAQIAAELCLSLATVKTHVRNLLGKLGAANRRQLFQTGA